MSSKHKLLFSPEFPLQRRVLPVVERVLKRSRWELLREAVTALAA